MTARLTPWFVMAAFVLLAGWLGAGVLGADSARVAAAPGEALLSNAASPGAPAGGAAVSGSPGGIAGGVDPAWAHRVSSATQIPYRALLGYAGAALAMTAEQPRCGLGWTTLAALGSIESAHGGHDGSRIDPDGTTRPGVFGPELDGSGYEAIPEGASGDGAWARAAGPLQFIPSTWAAWGTDASGDGIADPQQIDDAALAAARYLCSYGALSEGERWRTAVFAYNHLDSYVDEIAATANSYSALTGTR